MKNQWIIAQEGLRIFLESKQRLYKGWTRHQGDAPSICRQIVNRCWNGRYFQSSTGHFKQFYARDFGLSMSALVQLGFQKECIHTIQYALSQYALQGKITVGITPSGTPFDFPNTYSPDSVAHMFRCLALLNKKQIVEAYQDFLQSEIDRFFLTVIDPETGLPKRTKHFAGMKDYAIRDASCYDACMIAVLERAVRILDFENPLRSYPFKKVIKDTYWREDHFIDDLSGDSIPTADANIVPFFFGVFEHQGMLKAAIHTIAEQHIDTPIPLRYDPPGARTHQLWYERFLVPNWERTMAWSNLATIYLTLLRKAHIRQWKAQEKKYCSLIERHGTLFECYTPHGEPYTSRWYHADEGLIWAALFLKEKNK